GSQPTHPNIVTIYELLRDGNRLFIAEELVEGETLRALLTNADGTARRLPVEKAVDIAWHIAQALQAAHTAWIVHRDIKPENVMVRADGLVKVLDFGIAKLNEESPEPHLRERAAAADGRLTLPGAVLGTASYMSPEQARGESPDGRTDLYALAVIL